jgi:hypothetical protein
MTHKQAGAIHQVAFGLAVIGVIFGNTPVVLFAIFLMLHLQR